MRRGLNCLVGIAGVGILALASGCGGSGQTTTVSTVSAAAQTPTSVAQPSASALQAEARQHKKEAAEKRRRELLVNREAAEQHRLEVARHRREAAERHVEEHLGHGLGAKEPIFNAENTVGEGPDPPAGVAWFHVLYKVGDRVAAFNINANFTPAPSTHELIALMSMHNLPEDAQVMTEQASCVVWRSGTLRRLLGNEFAEGFVEPGASGYAELITTARPECH